MSGSKIGIVKMSASAIAVLLCASFALAHQFEELTNSIGMVFVPIPAGEFMRGSEDGDSDERPVHRVIISQPFYLGKYEVTQAQWQALMGSNPTHFTERRHPNLPVDSVSWHDVQEFIKILNAWEGHGKIYRLPTEAEWEYAVRAGTTTTYHFGNEASQLKDYAWYRDNADDKAHVVGLLRPNTWGLHDMYGNVVEWVQDWKGPYATGSVTDPTGVTTNTGHRVVRGCSWVSYFPTCRSAQRRERSPGVRHNELGFRLLRTAP